jgi:hypothetical protein
VRFVDIQDEVKDLINFTSAADQDFTLNQVKKAINRAYEREVLRAQQAGYRLWFHKTDEFTWPASSVTRELPSGLQQALILTLEDVTDVDPGTPLPHEVHWKDNRTLQWGQEGPASARTVRATYYARPTALVNDGDEPELIPPEQRMLLVWSSAVLIRQKADEGAPQDWKDELREARFDFWKAISRGRPYYGSGQGSKWQDPSITGAQATQDGSSINQDNN